MPIYVLYSTKGIVFYTKGIVFYVLTTQFDFRVVYAS